MNFELKQDHTNHKSTAMDALTAYSSSDEDDDKTPEIDPHESAKVVSRLKERFPLNSAPAVLGKVGIN